MRRDGSQVGLLLASDRRVSRLLSEVKRSVSLPPFRLSAFPPFPVPANSQFQLPFPRFPIPDSRFPIPDSRCYPMMRLTPDRCSMNHWPRGDMRSS